MKAVSVTGPTDTGKTSLVERLVDRLHERGQVGTVKHIDCDPDVDTAGKDTARHREAGAVRTYGIAADGWFATGEPLSLDDALGELAPRCEYALVEGYGGSNLPTIALGGVNVDDPLLAAPTADDLSLEEAVTAVEAAPEYVTLASLVHRVTDAPDAGRAGAVATFTGRVRERDHPDDEATEYLEFERYDPIANERLETIRHELESRAGVYEVRLHHRTGVVEAGDDIVFVVILADHRQEAFRAVEDGIDRLKNEVPLFKKEVTVSEEFWAHEQ